MKTAPTPLPMVASSLASPLLDGSPQTLHVAHRSRLAVQLADATGRVVLGVTFPGAVRLPFACAVAPPAGASSSFSVGGGVLAWGDNVYAATRWWRPPRPRHQALAPAVDDSAVRRLSASWRGLLGRGSGLTPYGDDVLCGALVTLNATRHPGAAALARKICDTHLEASTTATSSALLRAACEGWCIDQLADHLSALALSALALRALTGAVDGAGTRAALLSVGSSSGRGLLEGIALVLPGIVAEDAA